MPGIGMNGKYTWTKPPAFFYSPGDYDYMPNATKYTPKSLSEIEEDMKEILNNMYEVVNNTKQFLCSGQNYENLKSNWNDFFSINDEAQEPFDHEKLHNIGEETGSSFDELSESVNSYFKEAKEILEKINNALITLEENAQKVEKAQNELNDDSAGNKEIAQSYLKNVYKYGEEYTYFSLSKIGRWIY